MLKDSKTRYGWVTITLHWTVVLMVITLFVLGLWMVELDYYHPWYNRAPDIHRSIGVCVVLLMVLRLIWRMATPTPDPLPTLATWEARASVTVHLVFYVLVPLVGCAGYLMSTADGRGVEVFGLVEIPATITGLENQEDIAGNLHYYLAVTLIVLAGLHGVAALKHHFVDKDRTLKRMVAPGK